MLVVDDEASARELVQIHLEEVGCATETAADGAEAWERLTTGGDPPFDVVLLDWMMPGMDGLELLGKIKESPDFETLPVILQTAKSDRQDLLTGIAAGAYYYLTKPCDCEVLQLIVSSACRDHRHHDTVREALRRHSGALQKLMEARFEYRTVAEAEDLAALLSTACPEPERTAIGLSELLVNAVEHGNLGITYEEKSELLLSGTWENEIAYRQSMPENRNKLVEVEFQRLGSELRVTIRDQGRGFDWQRYLDFKPERLFDSHGRGIALASAMSFASIDYHAPGNEVVAVVRPPGASTS